jgi:hypothetical protein
MTNLLKALGIAAAAGILFAVCYLAADRYADKQIDSLRAKQAYACNYDKTSPACIGYTDQLQAAKVRYGK